MANKPKSPMPISERAKQFLPFAAVKGLNEALERKEMVAVSRVEMSEVLAAELNEKINRVQKGATITITYYSNNEFLKVSGRVIQIDTNFRTIQLDDTIIDMKEITGLEL